MTCPGVKYLPTFSGADIYIVHLIDISVHPVVQCICMHPGASFAFSIGLASLLYYSKMMEVGISNCQTTPG